MKSVKMMEKTPPSADKIQAPDGTVASPQTARTEPLSDSKLPDANVGTEDHCVLMAQDGEMARPDTGAPCNDGRDAQ